MTLKVRRILGVVDLALSNLLCSLRPCNEEPVQQPVPEVGAAKMSISEPDRVARFVAKARAQYHPLSIEEEDAGNGGVSSIPAPKPLSHYLSLYLSDGMRGNTNLPLRTKLLL